MVDTEEMRASTPTMLQYLQIRSSPRAVNSMPSSLCFLAYRVKAISSIQAITIFLIESSFDLVPAMRGPDSAEYYSHLYDPAKR